ncbi:MAG TPA: GNAT family N-acetyltransferase [Ignavibacteriales bacterium]|nr:GNAT family N-acetyltransferase [Ignavibacteriales bacterium]
MEITESAEILSSLKKDKIKNISIINFMKNYPVSYSAVCGGSFIIKGKSDKLWTYICSDNEDEFKELLNHIDKEDKNFAVLDQWMLPLMPQFALKLWELRAVKFYLPDNVLIDSPEFACEKLNESDAAFMLANSDYKDYLTEEYLAERIAAGSSCGIKVNGKLASWAFTHDDGAIGALHTLEEYRGRGYAAAVMKNIISELRKRDDLPFAYVEETNTNSLNLLKKLGFIPDRTVSWFEIP